MTGRDISKDFYGFIWIELHPLAVVDLWALREFLSQRGGDREGFMITQDGRVELSDALQLVSK